MHSRWKAVLEGKSTLIDGDMEQIKKLSERFDKEIQQILLSFDSRSWYAKLSEEQHGTVNVLALDSEGELIAAVSTSGLALKFPGRAGDSPIVGAGFYASSHAAAACVGTGELTIRLSLARMAVHDMEIGIIPHEASKRAIADLSSLRAKGGTVQILCLNSKGEDGGATNAPKERGLYYWVMTNQDSEPKKVITPLVAIK
jgi:isoaspartyl peptidase/L-asparaginase-like protein (Ntn-hydrolase superfamily)